MVKTATERYHELLQGDANISFPHTSTTVNNIDLN